jgi:hypothetical protein
MVPIVFLDVDGVLLPMRARPGSRRPAPDSGNPLLDRLDPADGPRLLALGAELVWATSWLSEANAVLSPRLGLPSLPVVTWPDDESEVPRGVHWKTPAIVRWAAGRPFAWLDDEATDADRHWVAATHPGAALVHRIDPLVGLTVTAVETVGRWLGAL